MLRKVAKTVQSVVSDAYSSLTSSNDRNGLSATAVASKNSSAAVGRTGKSPVSQTKRKVDSMSADSPQYTRSVGRFLKDFEAQEEAQLAKDSSEQQQASTSPRSTKRTSHGSSDRAEERRLLGIPEKSHPDATPVTPPMSRQSFVLKGGFRPHDTLNQPKSARANLYFDTITRKSIPANTDTRSNQKHQSNHMVHENNHEYPNKRQRNGSSPIKGSSRLHAISLDDNQDVEQGVLSSPSMNTTQILGRKKSRIGGLRRVSPSTFGGNPSIDTISSDLTKDVGTVGPVSRSRLSGSPDELRLDDEFTKKARQERIEREQSGHRVRASAERKTKDQLNDMLLSSPVSNSHRRNSVDSVKQSRPKSRIEQRLLSGEESPDALQGGCTTVDAQLQKRHKKAIRKDSNTDKSIPVQQHTRSIRNERNRTQRFPLSSYVYFDVPVSEDVKMDLVIDFEARSIALELHEALLTSEPIFTVPTKHIKKFIYSEEDESPRVFLITIHSENNKKIYLKFVTYDDAVHFHKALNSMEYGIQFVERDSRWMDGVFANAPKHFAEIMERTQQRGKLFQPQPQSTVNSTPRRSNYFPAGQTGVQKARRKEQIDNSTSTTVISGAERLGDISELSPKNDKSLNLPGEVGAGAPPRLSARTTRSQANKSDEVSSTDVVIPVKKPSVFNTLKRWRKPLVYPQTGKKRETVQFDDLQRLDEDEFLNDNLVCLFLRYLEEHADREQMKKIHFFNSFLFEALTKDVKVRRDINFDAVKRWTTKVDLFNRDFVVVPVNEHLHWFVMIICNLSYFRRKHAPKQDDDDDENDCNSQIAQSLQSAAGSEPLILRSDLEDENEMHTRSSFAEMSLDDPNPSSNSPINKSFSHNKGRKRLRRSLQKYDVDKPVIITLDSLGQARSTTATILRQYIVAEAKDKKGWDIDGNEIKGMTAKGIPHQNNFSDCGLYLCMYLEQFILDPYGFVRRILQRHDEAGWPSRIESSDLRDNLRFMLRVLHKQQHPDGQETDPQLDVPLRPLGSLLIDRNLPEYQENRVMEVADIRAAKKRGEEKVNQEAPQASKSPEHRVENEVLIDSLDDWKQSINETITIEDDELQTTLTPESKRQSKLKSHYFTQPSRLSAEESISDTHDQPHHGDPAALASYLRNQRSPDRRVAKKREASDSPKSITTDFLAGGQSYGLPLQETESRSRKSPTMQLDANRRAHKKFKNHEQAPIASVEIEDSEFEGFGDAAQPLAAELAADDDQSSRQKSRPRQILRDITEDARHDASVVHVTEENQGMLV